MSMTTFVILALATQRLHFLWLTQALFSSARNGIGSLSTFLNYAVNCAVCTSVWAGVIVYVLFEISWLGQLIDYALALSSGLAIINAVMNLCESVVLRLAKVT